jgi:hypothetical protein
MLIRIDLARFRLESRNRKSPTTGSFHQGGNRMNSTTPAIIAPTASVRKP